MAEFREIRPNPGGGAVNKKRRKFETKFLARQVLPIETFLNGTSVAWGSCLLMACSYSFRSYVVPESKYHLRNLPEV
jgi:hypothetical protein